jgi:hypothetical protein
VARIYENGCFNLHIVTLHDAKVSQGSFPVWSERSVLQDCEQKLGLVISDILLNLPKISVRNL